MKTKSIHAFHMTKGQIYLASFLIPVLIMAGVSVCLQMYPFGNNTILVADMNYQFVDYYAYFKSIILGNNDFSYTFSKTLGGDMAGLSSYYLQSPFNFLFLLFPTRYMPVAMLLVIILKIGCCGLTFQIFLSNLRGPRAASLIFSTGYALMSYMTAYVNSVIYFDSIILLPLLMLGIYRIVKQPEKKLLYFLTLFAAMVVNYYVAFMFCIFAVIFFLYQLAVQGKKWKEMLQPAVSFALTSIAGAMAAAFTLLPTVLSLSDVKEQADAGKLALYRNFPLYTLPARLYSNSFNGNISDGLPVIFCGILTAAFAAYYLFSKSVALKQKLAALCVFAALTVSFYINTFNIIWHGMNHPIGFPYRYSFLFSFMLLYIGYEGFLLAERERNRQTIALVGLLFVLVSVFILLTRNLYASFADVAWDGLLVAAGLAALLFFRKTKWGISLLTAAALLLQLADLSVDARHAISQYPLYAMSDYMEYADRTGGIAERLQQEDDSFYRMEKLYRRTHNDAMAFAYNGLSHFSSSEKGFVKTFMGRLGFRDNGNWAFYNNGSTCFADAFLGVKYVLSQYGVTGKRYEEQFVHDSITVLENPFAMPLVMGAGEAIRQVDMEQTDLFALQNDIAAAVAGGAGDLYTPVHVLEARTDNLVQEDGKEGFITYRKADAGKEASLTYVLQVERADLLYGYFTAPALQSVKLFKNGLEEGIYFDRYRWDIVELGGYEPGSVVEITLKPQEETMSVGESFFYYENRAALADWRESAGVTQGELTKITSSHLTGKVQAAKDTPYLLITFPYERGWRVEIDGQRAEPFMVLDALMAVPVEPGSHTLELHYVTDGFYAGAAISLLGLAGAAIYVVLAVKKRKRDRLGG